MIMLRFTFLALKLDQAIVFGSMKFNDKFAVEEVFFTCSTSLIKCMYNSMLLFFPKDY